MRRDLRRRGRTSRVVDPVDARFVESGGSWELKGLKGLNGSKGSLGGEVTKLNGQVQGRQERNLSVQELRKAPSSSHQGECVRMRVRVGVLKSPMRSRLLASSSAWASR